MIDRKIGEPKSKLQNAKSSTTSNNVASSSSQKDDIWQRDEWASSEPNDRDDLSSLTDPDDDWDDSPEWPKLPNQSHQPQKQVTQAIDSSRAEEIANPITEIASAKITSTPPAPVPKTTDKTKTSTDTNTAAPANAPNIKKDSQIDQQLEQLDLNQTKQSKPSPDLQPKSTAKSVEASSSPENAHWVESDEVWQSDDLQHQESHRQSHPALPTDSEQPSPDEEKYSTLAPSDSSTPPEHDTTTDSGETSQDLPKQGAKIASPKTTPPDRSLQTKPPSQSQALDTSANAPSTAEHTDHTDDKTPPIQTDAQPHTAQPGWVDSFSGARGYLLVFVFAFLIYAVFLGQRIGQVSSDPHYVFLADSILDGRWYLKGPPKHPITDACMTNDWSYIDQIKVTKLNGKPLRRIETLRGHWQGNWQEFCSGQVPLHHTRTFRTLKQKWQVQGSDVREYQRKYFVSFPPLPAIIMAAPMWLLDKLGYDRLRFSDVTFTLFFAALSVFLLFWLLQRLSLSGKSSRTLYENLQLTGLFAFGTVFFFVAVQGTVWFTALIVGVCCSIAFLIAAEDAKHPLIAGILVSMAFLSRPLLLLLGFFFLWQVIRQNGQWLSPFQTQRLKKLCLFALPITATIAGIMYFNHLRFANPFEFGHSYLPAVLGRVSQYGLFHTHWFVRNFYAFFLAMPEISLQPLSLKINAHGLSLFITTPALILLFINRRRHVWFWGLLLTTLLILIPQLFYQNTGWLTFGNRFSLDYLPLIFVMFAISSIHFGRLWNTLLIIAIAINTFGAISFGRLERLYNTRPESLDWVWRIFS
jgi:hypothetical protein